jgi:hypothetical protein
MQQQVPLHDGNIHLISVNTGDAIPDGKRPSWGWCENRGKIGGSVSARRA